MTDSTPLTGKRLRSVIKAAASSLEANKEAVNALNVFPVPDGDTGTNMGFTVAAAVREMDKVTSSSLAEMVKALSLGSLMGARGNSGVILSQLFRGFGKSLQDKRSATALQVAWACEEGVETAYKAVMKPVEGTILTVAREMARAALQAAKKGATLEGVLEVAVVRGREVLARTPDMLPVLKQAGVVDAGGKGLLCLVEGALAAVSGKEEVEVEAGAETAAPLPVEAAGGEVESAADTAEEIEFAYDTQLLIKGERLAVDRIRSQLEPLGDSLLVVGDPHLVKIHVHTNEPHRAVATCLLHGEIIEASVENMREQHEAVQRERMKKVEPDDGVGRATAQLQPATHAGAPGHGGQGHSSNHALAGGTALAFPRGGPVSPSGSRQAQIGSAGAADLAPGSGSATVPAAEERVIEGPGVVVVSSGDGLEAILKNLGADMVVSGGQTMNPSTEDLLKAIESLPCDEVLVLPNNGNILLAAKQTVELTEKVVRVVPSRSIPQGIAALVALNRQMSADKNQARMEQALGQVKTGEITQAVRDSVYNGISIKTGDFIGLLDDEIVTVGGDAESVLRDLVSRMTGSDTEIVTLFYGESVEESDAEAAAAELRELASDHEIEVHRGGQPLYHYLISVE